MESAIEEIVAEAGRHFDPDLVERFAAIAANDDLDETDDRLRIDSLAALRASSRR